MLDEDRWRRIGVVFEIGAPEDSEDLGLPRKTALARGVQNTYCEGKLAMVSQVTGDSGLEAVLGPFRELHWSQSWLG